MKIVVYTAIFGDIDRLWSVYPLAAGNADHLAFTDRPLSEVGLWTDDERPSIRKGTSGMHPPSTWHLQMVEPEYSSRRQARHYKALAHRYIDADVTIWIDGNVRLLKPPEWIVDNYLGPFAGHQEANMAANAPTASGYHGCFASKNSHLGYLLSFAALTQ